jgi:hypothetical protein
VIKLIENETKAQAVPLVGWDWGMIGLKGTGAGFRFLTKVD